MELLSTGDLFSIVIELQMRLFQVLEDLGIHIDFDQMRYELRSTILECSKKVWILRWKWSGLVNIHDVGICSSRSAKNDMSCSSKSKIVLPKVHFLTTEKLSESVWKRSSWCCIQLSHFEFQMSIQKSKISAKMKKKWKVYFKMVNSLSEWTSKI